MLIVLRAGVLMAFIGASGAVAAPVGSCGFDAATLSFAGSPVEQARCLLRTVRKFGKLDPAPAALAAPLGKLIGNPPQVDEAKLRSALSSRGISISGFQHPVSRARGGDPSAPSARYFVIHDTSSPWLKDAPFPPDIDTSSAVNGLDRYMGSDSVAHVFVNRSGTVAFGHDFSVPWRATKLENKLVGLPAKGLFLHVENVQPRRRDPSGGPKNDAIAPLPGLTSAQYDRLAALYAYSSYRAKRWLIPALHAAVDAGLAGGHDDPQNFELSKFAAALSALLQETGAP